MTFSHSSNTLSFVEAAREVKSKLSREKVGPLARDEIWIKSFAGLAEKYKLSLFTKLNDLDIFDSRYCKRNRLSDSDKNAELASKFNNFLDRLEFQVKVDKLINPEKFAVQTDSFDIEIDDNWKAKASSYVAHIRIVISKAEMHESLRERIFKALNVLQLEIDRNRARLDSITEIFLGVTEAVAKGTKHLDGAVKLVERLAGAFSGARSAKIAYESQLKLPPPDSVGLSDLE